MQIYGIEWQNTIMTLQKTISKTKAQELRDQRPELSPPLAGGSERWFPVLPARTAYRIGGDELQMVRVASGSFQPAAHIWENGAPFYRFSYVRSGSAQIYVDGAACALKPGHVFGRPAQEAHDIIVDSRSPLSLIVVNVRGAEAAALHAGLFMTECPTYRAENNELALWQSIVAAAQESGGHDSRRLCASYLRIILIQAQQRAQLQVQKQVQKQVQRKQGNGLVVHKNQQARARFEQCRSYIDKNFLSISSIASVAVKIGIDPSHMGRLFRRFEGMTSHAYVQGLKMQFAGEQLLSSDKQIQDIAAELGFEDPFVFTRSFKRIMGCSPSAYRRL